MERPEYEGVRYYSPDDLSVGHYYDRAVEVLSSLEFDKQYQNINEVIELYEIQELFCRANLREEYGKPYRDEIKRTTSIVAKYFKGISSENLYEEYCSVCIDYIDVFWRLFDKFKVYNNVSEESFADLLNKPDTTLNIILENKNIVKHYDEIIAKNMRRSDQSAEIIVSKFLEEKTHNIERERFLPSSLLPQEYEKILTNYIDSEIANIEVVRLIAESQSSKECPISNKLRLQAKKRSEKYWNEHKDEGVSIEYGISISYEKSDQPVSVIQEGPCLFKYIYDIKWIVDNLDFPTLLNNFIYLFEYVDLHGRSQFPAKKSELGIFERFMGVKGIKEYVIGTSYKIKDMRSSTDMMAYKDILYKNNIRIENVIRWFFVEYLSKEFGIAGFVFNEISEGSSTIEKCRSLASEMDGIFRQFKMFVEDGAINRELLEISSNPIVIGELPSFIENKYAYSNSTEIIREQDLLFSDQCMLAHVPKYEEHYNCFFDLVQANDVNIADYRDYDKPQLAWLQKRGTITIDEDGKIGLNIIRARILRDLFYSSVICPSYKETYVDESVKNGDLIYESRLFSRPETEYLNYVLNKAEYANGLDLRNKYIHSTYPMDERTQELDYIYLLKVMMMVVLKINEEFCLREK